MKETLLDDRRYYWRRYAENFWGWTPKPFFVFLFLVSAILLGTFILAGLAIAKWGQSEVLRSTGYALEEGQDLTHLWYDATGRLIGTGGDKWKVRVLIWNSGNIRPRSYALDLDALTPPDKDPVRPLYDAREQALLKKKMLDSPRQMQRIPPDQQTAPPTSPPRTLRPLPVEVSYDGSRIAWLWSGRLFVKELEGDNPPRMFEVGKESALLAFPAKGVAALLLGKNILFLDVDGGKPVKEVPSDFAACSVGGFGIYLVQACPGRRIVVFEVVEQGVREGEFSQNFPVLARFLNISPAGRQLAYGYSDGTVRVLAAGSEAKVTLFSTPGVVENLVFYDEKRAIVGGGFRGIYLLAPGQPPQAVVPDVAGTKLLAFNGLLLAYAGSEETRIARLIPGQDITPAGLWIAGAWMLFAVAFLLVPALRVAIEELEKDRELRLRESLESKWTAPLETSTPALPLPEPPEELIQAFSRNNSVAYLGAGLSASAGFPTWPAFLRNLLDWAVEQQVVDPVFGGSLRAALEEGYRDKVADSIVGSFQGRETLLHDYLRKTFLEPQAPLPAAYRLLRDIPFAAVLTTNFDNLLERTFQDRQAPLRTHRDAEALLEAPNRNEFFLLKLYGTLERPETVLVAPSQYQEAVAKNNLFSQFIGSLFFSRTILFVGCSPEGIEAYLRGLSFQGGVPHTHYALMSVVGAAWQAQADSLRRRYNIQVLPYTSTPGHPQVVQFLEKLRQAVQTQAASGAVVQEASRLQSVTLQNIGPFERLSLELAPGWNVLLGDNGVGKSTVLKAIAVAVCGKDAEPYAGRLIRSGEREATITLETDQKKRYITTIERRDTGTVVTSPTSRPLEAEGWLVLGFPPLRGGTWSRPKAPPPGGLGRPTAEDVLPIAKGDPDPRLDKLKEWIIWLDYQISKLRSTSASQGSGKPLPSRYEEQRDEFFRIMDTLTPGVKLEFADVDPKTYEVRVRTDDGIVPLEAVSQGTTSLLGWVGVLLQRLYDLYGPKDGTPSSQVPPRMRYALVLIDEIDAHMHPKWQQLIAAALKENFPAIQVLATTHSPLIITGLPPEEVLLIRRDPEEKRVVVQRSEQDLRRWRADQVLTGPLFSLSSTVDPKTYADVRRYTELSAQSQLSEADQEELRRLSESLDVTLPNPKEREEARLAFEKIEAALNQQLSEMPLEKQKRVLEEAKVQLQESITGSRRPA